MPADKVCKTVHQYNKTPVAKGDMQKLQEIAEDYNKVKNYVYTRFGGIGSLSKLYPGYTVQNEMTKSGLREELGLPSVYFYLAVFDALKDIKSQWTRTKTRVLRRIGKNENFSEEEKHYLRFVLKVSNAFEAVLNQVPMELPGEIRERYETVSEGMDTEKLHRYLCRQTRKYHVKLHTDVAQGFSISKKAYRYKDHGIYIASKENRKRIFIPLTDSNQYTSQLYIKLYPEQNRIEIKAPVNVTVKNHADYGNQVGISLGMYTMLTTDRGSRYGEKLGEYQFRYADWIRAQTISYNRNRNDNPGRKKYHAQKKRLEEQMHSYINQELNRFLETEKPKAVYLPRYPKPRAGGVDARTNHAAALWQRGYIRSRLTQKCKEQAVEVVEVPGKEISSACSQCGAAGMKQKRLFVCPSCGYSEDNKINAAINAKKRGTEEES